jgi:uncharacterized protein (DUF2336 family)
MIAEPSLIAELEDAIQSGSKDKRVDTLRRITDLFVAGADRFNDQQIEVFDDVLGHLIKRIESKALAELSQRLGPMSNAPIETVRQLARDDDIAVAEPILTHSRRLSDSDLVDIANTKSQGHLLAIAGRTQVGTGVTDVLLQRGDTQVFHKLAENSGASFSEQGFTTLVRRSEHDATLAERVGLRLDVPLKLFRELLLRATEAVRSRLLAAAGAENRDKIQRILSDISEGAQHEAGFQSEKDFADAYARMQTMKNNGELNEATLFEAAKADRYADIVAALSLLCGAPMTLVGNLLQADHREAWIVPCKVAALSWQTVRTVMNCRSLGQRMPDQTLDAARADYQKLSQTSAARVLRFWQVRQTSAGQPAPSSNLATGIPVQNTHSSSCAASGAGVRRVLS